MKKRIKKARLESKLTVKSKVVSRNGCHRCWNTKWKLEEVGHVMLFAAIASSARVLYKKLAVSALFSIHRISDAPVEQTDKEYADTCVVFIF